MKSRKKRARPPAGNSRRKKAAARSGIAKLCPGPAPVAIPEEIQQHHDAGVLIRQEAAVAEKGELPPGATHEIVGHDQTGQPVLKRRRFSLT